MAQITAGPRQHSAPGWAAAVLMVLFVAIPRGGLALEADDITIRLYERDRHGNLVERPVPQLRRAAHRAVALRPVAEEDVSAALRRAGATRSAALVDVERAPSASRLVPEDLTRRARVVHVAVEQYTDAAFAEVAARVGLLEGFTAVARVPVGREWAQHLRIPNLAVIELPGRQYVWTEDVLEVEIGGGLRMTARVGDRALLRRTLVVDRVRRFYPDVAPAQLEALARFPTAPGEPPGELPLEVRRQYPDTMFMLQGLVERDAGQEVAAALAVARRAPLREALTYLEGGNVLLGTLPGGEPYALVGRDSAAVSRALLERHLRRPVSEAETVRVMAKDLGVTPARLFLVEQPGVFHLDMAMTLLRPGTVVLNDAVEAFRLQTRWLWEDHERWRPARQSAQSEEDYHRDVDLWQEAGRDVEATLAKLSKYTERFARYEARTLADLRAAGLTVVRLPGRFLHPARPWDRDVMNFLNGEAGTNPQGRTYFITQGGDPRAERHVVAALLGPGLGLDRVYVAPRLVSRESLWEKGAANCRLKVEGIAIPPVR